MTVVKINALAVPDGHGEPLVQRTSRTTPTAMPSPEYTAPRSAPPRPPTPELRWVTPVDDRFDPPTARMLSELDSGVAPDPGHEERAPIRRAMNAEIRFRLEGH